MNKIDVINVEYHGRPVGRIAMGTRYSCLFEYDREWLVDGFSTTTPKALTITHATRGGKAYRTRPCQKAEKRGT